MEEREEIVAHARRESEEFRRLEQEHKALADEIELKFESKKFLTAEEELERKTLQKLKLVKKDQMYKILHDLKAVVN